MVWSIVNDKKKKWDKTKAVVIFSLWWLSTNYINMTCWA